MEAQSIHPLTHCPRPLWDLRDTQPTLNFTETKPDSSGHSSLNDMNTVPRLVALVPR
jgi:hypothetical protein